MILVPTSNELAGIAVELVEVFGGSGGPQGNAIPGKVEGYADKGWAVDANHEQAHFINGSKFYAAVINSVPETKAKIFYTLKENSSGQKEVSYRRVWSAQFPFPCPDQQVWLEATHVKSVHENPPPVEPPVEEPKVKDYQITVLGLKLKVTVEEL